MPQRSPSAGRLVELLPLESVLCAVEDLGEIWLVEGCGPSGGLMSTAESGNPTRLLAAVRPGRLDSSGQGLECCGSDSEGWQQGIGVGPNWGNITVSIRSGQLHLAAAGVGFAFQQRTTCA